jgi:phenylalanyl-tRNA synthetase beta chain
MVVELAGGKVLESVIDEIATPIHPIDVDLPLSEVGRILGSELGREEIVGILGRLGMEVGGTDPLRVTVPTYRPDVTRPADVVEEIARIHGYDRLPSTLPLGTGGGLTPEQKRLRALYAALAGIGLHQTVTLPFVGREALTALGWDDDDALLEVTNPLREEESTLRPTMLPGLLDVVRFNLSHGTSSLGLFESALVFRNSPWEEDDLPAQVARLSWILTGEVGPSRLGVTPIPGDGEVSLAVLRHVMDVMGHSHYSLRPAAPAGYHPGRTAAVSLGDRFIGHVGELSPRAARQLDLPGRVGIAELDLDPLIAPVKRVPAVSPSVFPHVEFDLSFVLPDDLQVGAIIEGTVDAGGGLVESSRVFDVFQGPGVDEGTRAVAIRYRLRATDHTLTNEEVGPVRQAMIAVAETLGARLRGA